MNAADIATLKPGETLVWHKPGKRYGIRVEYAATYNDKRVWIRVGGLLTTAAIRNLTRPPIPSTRSTKSTKSTESTPEEPHAD